MKISDRRIIIERIVPGSPRSLWKRWTTREGLMTFFGADNNVELRPDGPYEIYFLMDNPPGLRGSEGCRVLSYLPEKMLSFSWNAPPQFQEIRNSDYHTWVVLLFRGVGDEKTEVTLTHLGWPDDSRWDEVFRYFESAWERVMDGLAG